MTTGKERAARLIQMIFNVVHVSVTYLNCPIKEINGVRIKMIREFWIIRLRHFYDSPHYVY